MTHWTINIDSKSFAIHDNYEMPECLKGTITHVISDNAANMIKTFNLPGFKSSDPDPREKDRALDSECDVESDFIELEKKKKMNCSHILHNTMDVLHIQLT